MVRAEAEGSFGAEESPTNGGRRFMRRPAVVTKCQCLLSVIILSLLWWPGDIAAETMYVTDRLYLSLRRTPNTEEPALVLLPSDTKVDVLTKKGDWAQVKLEDGKTGWVLKRFLVKERPKSQIIEELKREIESKNALLEKLQKESVSREQAISDQAAFKAREEALLKRIDALKSKIAEQTKHVEVNTKEQTVKRLKEVYVTGIVAFFLGLIVGYMLRKPKKRQLFS